MQILLRGMLLVPLFTMLMLNPKLTEGFIDECKSLSGIGEKNKLPFVDDRDEIFACAGVTKFISKLDQLDKDLLFLRASHLSLRQLEQKATDTNPPKKYKDLIPVKNLKKLQRLVTDYYSKGENMEFVPWLDRHDTGK